MGSDIPVVLATGSVPPDQGRQPLGDSDQILPRPYTAAQLRDAVDNALRYAAPG